MKVCHKCGRVYDDKAFFCNKCGEKLTEHSVCPRCGAPVSKEDKFCNKCGYNITGTRQCPKCGAEIKNQSEFCPQCGEPLKQHTQYYSSKNKSGNTAAATRYAVDVVLISIFFVICLIGLIGFFGDILRTTGIKATVGIEYFFGDGIEQIRSIRDNSNFVNDAYYQFNLKFYIIYCFAYFGGIVGMLCTTIVGICYGIKSISKKVPFSPWFYVGAILSCLPYLMLTMFQASISTNFLLGVTYGWGTGMLVAAVIMSGICFITSFITHGVDEKRSVPARALISVAFFFMVLAALFGVSKHLTVTYKNVSGSYSLFYPYSQYLAQYSTTGNYYVTAKLADLELAFIFAVIYMVFLLMSVSSLASDKKSASITALIMLILTFVLALASGILGTNALESSIGGGIITTLVLSAISTILVSISLAFKNN